MKYIITLLLLTISGLSFSQSLVDTKWDIYLDGSLEAISRFSADTFYIEEFDEIPFSIYNESLDTFRIKDFIGSPGGCFDIIGDEFGVYLFKIENDTLLFEVINDDCLGRAEVFTTAIFVKHIDTAVDETDVFSNVTLYPNPMVNGILNIHSDEKIDEISIYDAYGMLLVTSLYTPNIDLSRFSTSLFFIELKKGTKRKIIRVVNL